MNRNPTPAQLLGTQIVSGLGLGTGFAVASKVVPVAFTKLGVKEAPAPQSHRNPDLDDNLPAVSGLPNHTTERGAAMAAMLTNPRRKLHPALIFMNERVKELHAGGMPMRQAMKKAGAEWRAKKRERAARQNPPPMFTVRTPGQTQRIPIVSGAKFMRMMPVHFKRNDVTGIITDVKAGKEEPRFKLGRWAIGTKRGPTMYDVQTRYGTKEPALEDDLEQDNPLSILASPLVLLTLALLGYGWYQRMRPVTPPLAQ